jgi:hypothetical protein
MASARPDFHTLCPGGGLTQLAADFDQPRRNLFDTTPRKQLHRVV